MRIKNIFLSLVILLSTFFFVGFFEVSYALDGYASCSPPNTCGEAAGCPASYDCKGDGTGEGANLATHFNQSSFCLTNDYSCGVTSTACIVPDNSRESGSGWTVIEGGGTLDDFVKYNSCGGQCASGEMCISFQQPVEIGGDGFIDEGSCIRVNTCCWADGTGGGSDACVLNDDERICCNSLSSCYIPDGNEKGECVICAYNEGDACGVIDGNNGAYTDCCSEDLFCSGEGTCTKKTQLEFNYCPSFPYIAVGEVCYDESWGDKSEWDMCDDCVSGLKGIDNFAECSLPDDDIFCRWSCSAQTTGNPCDPDIPHECGVCRTDVVGTVCLDSGVCGLPECSSEVPPNNVCSTDEDCCDEAITDPSRKLKCDGGVCKIDEDAVACSYSGEDCYVDQSNYCCDFDDDNPTTPLTCNYSINKCELVLGDPDACSNEPGTDCSEPKDCCLPGLVCGPTDTCVTPNDIGDPCAPEGKCGGSGGGMCNSGLKCVSGVCTYSPDCELVDSVDTTFKPYENPIQNLGPLLGYIRAILYVVAILLGLITIIKAGYKYMVSQGDPSKVKDAQEELTAAIIGIFFIVLSVFIMNIIIDSIIGFS